MARIQTKGSARLDKKVNDILNEYETEKDSLIEQLQTAYETMVDELVGVLDEAYDEGYAEHEAGENI